MEFDSIHPGKEEYMHYLQGSLADQETVRLERHLAICEFCRELLENLTLQMNQDSDPGNGDIPSRVKELADRLYTQSLRGRLIHLRPLEEPDIGPSVLMAADGQMQDKRSIESLGTVYSDNPEIVLCLMRDNKLGQYYLQVVSDDPNLFENVLVEAPQIGQSVVTDKNGRADLHAIKTDSPSDLRWQIRMPEAVFELEEFTFDPDSTEYHRETILDSDQGDRIRVTLEGKGEGKQIELEILELDGNTDIGQMQVMVSLDDDLKTFHLHNQNKVVIDSSEQYQTMRIRLYT